MSSATAVATKWTATYHNETLKVAGEVLEPTPGFTLTLHKAEPQGINPAILLLKLVTKAPKGTEPDHTVLVPVTFSEHTKHHYTEVQIVPGGPTIKVHTS